MPKLSRKRLKADLEEKIEAALDYCPDMDHFTFAEKKDMAMEAARKVLEMTLMLQLTAPRR